MMIASSDMAKTFDALGWVFAFNHSIKQTLYPETTPT